MLSWPSQVSRSGMLWGALAACCFLLGDLGCASAQSPSDTRQLLLFDAVSQNNSSGVRSIILAGVDVARPDVGGRTAMDVAVEKGHFAVAQQLILARQLQQQILTANIAQSEPVPGPSPFAANPARAQQVQVPNIQATQVAATRILPPAPQISTEPIDKLWESASKLSRGAAPKSRDRHELQTLTAPKAIPRTPSALSNPDKSRITAPSPKPAVREETYNMVGPSQAGRIYHLANDRSVQAIGDDAFKTALTDAASDGISIEENSDPGPEPLLPSKPERKTDFTATAKAGATPGGTPEKVTNMKVETVSLQPASPGLDRLRRRLKTISRDQLKYNLKTNKTLSESKTTGQANAPRKSQPLFLNRIFNSITDLLGLDDDKPENSQQ